MKLNNRRLPQKNTKSFTNGKLLCYHFFYFYHNKLNLNGGFENENYSCNTSEVFIHEITRKPLKDIRGKPMLWWVYRQVSNLGVFDEVVCAIDDERIREM